MPKSVLFVCLGNICRSTMAQGVMEELVRREGAGDIVSCVDSCGTAAYHVGDAPDPRTLWKLRQHDIALDHRGRQLESTDFEKFDYILAMDRQNLRDIKDRAPKECSAKIALFGDFGSGANDAVIKDPYYGSDDGFERAYKQCEDFAKGLLQDARKRVERL